MTDITEMAQREKFEAWWERAQHNGNPPRFGWSHWRDGEGYKVDDDDSELEGMWEAWKAAGAELVEALENAQQHIAELKSRTEKLPELCVGVVQGGHAVIVPYAAGHWFNKTAILEMLAAAGIKWERE